MLRVEEMYRDKCRAADKTSIMKWWKTPEIDPALIPGSFAESVFANPAERRYEYSYIKDNVIEEHDASVGLVATQILLQVLLSVCQISAVYQYWECCGLGDLFPS